LAGFWIEGFIQDKQTHASGYKLYAAGEWIACLGGLVLCNRHVSCDCVRVTQPGGVGGSGRRSALGRDYVASELLRGRVRKKFDGLDREASRDRKDAQREDFSDAESGKAQPSDTQEKLTETHFTVEPVSDGR
jgi:hypothetical protein